MEIRLTIALVHMIGEIRELRRADPSEQHVIAVGIGWNDDSLWNRDFFHISVLKERS